MFDDLLPQDAEQKTSILLSHELKAAIRIIGWFVEKEGGEIKIPKNILATDYRVSVHSTALSDTIELGSWIH